MIDFSGTDTGDCTEISSVGSKNNAYYVLVQDVQNAVIGSIYF